MVRSAHLDDERLFECYLALRSGEPLDPPAADHLAECSDCAARYEELQDTMEAIRQEAEAEVDELFPADRLREQRRHILSRIDHLHRPARVITFPGREIAAGGQGTLRVTPRWLAAAAAAGLFIGVAVGGLLGPARFGSTVGPMQVATGASAVGRISTPPPAVRVTSSVPDAPDDDAFLMELELALARPRTIELVPLDAMTPHVRETMEGAAGPRPIVLDVR